MQQPREPIVYPNNMMSPVKDFDEDKNTLQSIDQTLKRIEAVLSDICSTCSKKKPIDIADLTKDINDTIDSIYRTLRE